jgi:hypothetical protein
VTRHLRSCQPAGARQSTTGCSQRTARRDTCLHGAHWTQRRQPTATTGCIARATRGARRHTCLPAMVHTAGEKSADCDHWVGVPRVLHELHEQLRHLPVWCTLKMSQSPTNAARATSAAQTPACMVHTGSRLRPLDVLHELHEQHDGHLPAWCTLNSEKAVDCDTGCAARSTSAAETTACMVHTLERSQQAASTGYRKYMPMHTHAHAIDGLWRTCNQCAAMNVCQSRSSIQECSLCLAGKHICRIENNLLVLVMKDSTASIRRDYVRELIVRVKVIE